MKSLVIFALILIAGAQCSSLLSQFPLNYGEDRSLLHMFVQVQNKMNEGGPLNAVTDMIDGVANQVKTEQANHDKIAQQNKADCQAEFKFRNKEIGDGKVALAAAQAQLKNCQTTLRTAEADLAQNLKTQRAREASLTALIKARREANALYLQRTRDHTEAVAAINEAIAMIDEIFSGAAGFAQLASSSGKMLGHAVNLRMADHYAPVLAVFSQIASNQVHADETALNKVKDLLRKLIKNLDASQKNYDQIEREEVAAFKKEKAALEAELKSLRGEEKKLRKLIADMKVCIGEQTGIINAATAKIARNSELLQLAQKMCKSFADDYKASTEKRNDELELIAKIKEIVMARYKQISAQVTERGLQSIQQWKKYKNATPYNPAEAYKRARGLFNSKGAEQAKFKKNEKLAAIEE